MEAWLIRETDPLEYVELNLPEPWKHRVFELTSKGKDNDSDKKYWLHWMWEARDGTAAWKEIIHCDCPDAKFKVPFVILGLYQCKHAKELKERCTLRYRE